MAICSMTELRTLPGTNTNEVGMSTLNGGPLNGFGQRRGNLITCAWTAEWFNNGPVTNLKHAWR